MSSERLTHKIPEELDRMNPKLQATKSRIASDNKDDPEDVNIQSRALSRSDSKKVLFDDARGQNDESHRLQRQSSSVSSQRPRPGLSVFRVVQAARAWKRLSQRKKAVAQKPKLLLENTYRLAPDPGKVFKPEKIERPIHEVLTTFLKNFQYSPEGCRKMALGISSEIKSRIKCLNYPRYKIICNVIIMENKRQGSDVSSRCLWSPDTDSFASSTYKTEQIICVATVHAVYFE